MSETFYGFVAGVLLASVFWAIFAARLLGRAADELEALETVLARMSGDGDLVEELDEWQGWGEYPPIPPHAIIGGAWALAIAQIFSAGVG